MLILQIKNDIYVLTKRNENKLKKLLFEDYGSFAEVVCYNKKGKIVEILKLNELFNES